MQQTLLHKTRTVAGILILTAVFLSVLVSLSLPSILELKNTDQEKLSLNFSEKDLKESYESPGSENEALEELDFYQDHVLQELMPHRNSSDRPFTSLRLHLSTADSDIQLPPPEYIAA